MSIESELQAALDDQGRFEALALIQLKTDQLLFLKAAEGTASGLSSALESFLLRAVTDTESLAELADGDEVVYYDLEQRQIILTPFKTKQGRYLFAAVAASNKTYKQVLKRLVKSLKTLL
jgi:hypothetical protein